jgi:hypothetical protein
MEQIFGRVRSIVLLLVILVLALLYAAQPSYAQAAVQQTFITWDAYVEPAPVAPATTIPLSVQLAGYQINWGSGAQCTVVASQLTTSLVFIPKAVAPGITPTVFMHNTYPDTNGIVCWEVFIKFNDGTFSSRSKRLYKEIISTRPVVANPVVQ